MLDVVVLIAGAGIPSLLIILWFYRMDKKRPEPAGLLGKAVLLGFLAAAPAVAIELLVDIPASFLPGLLASIWTAFVTAAIVEEGLKYFVLKRFVFRKPAWDELMDGIVYAVCVSLGFAFAENLLYGLASREALILRAFTSVPMHAAATGIMGYWLAMAKAEAQPTLRKQYAKKALWTAVAIHGLYDVFLFIGGLFALGALVVLAAALSSVKRLVQRAKEQDDRAQTFRLELAKSENIILTKYDNM